MTRKDYDLIARAISAARLLPYASAITLNGLVEILCAELADDNPRFDEKKFTQAAS